ncbi:hypothetical protein B0H10DRAFT_1953281 [Mycena sp. CBHHK59/15]|nr:hypothetical protein B0H10DRAFT_1953281 [Mycena sp. CBHHK59/15]
MHLRGLPPMLFWLSWNLAESLCVQFLAGLLGVYREDGIIRDGVYVFEDLISGSVPAPAIPPTFDNPFVIPKNLDMTGRSARCNERADEELKSNGFSPANVSAISFPAWEEPPGTPALANGDSNSNRKAGVGISMSINNFVGSRDGTREVWCLETLSPPL